MNRGWAANSSYTELLTCLEMARDVRTMHSDQANERANTPTQATPAAPVSTAPKAKPVRLTIFRSRYPGSRSAHQATTLIADEDFADGRFHGANGGVG